MPGGRGAQTELGWSVSARWSAGAVPGAEGEGERTARRIFSWLQGMPLGKPSSPDVRVGTYQRTSITAAPVGILLIPLRSPHRAFGEQAGFLQSHLGIAHIGREPWAGAGSISRVFFL